MEISESAWAKATSYSPCHQEPRGCVKTDGQSCGDGCEVQETIARAIMEERRECAEIAEDDNHTWYGKYENMAVAEEVAIRISLAIRNK